MHRKLDIQSLIWSPETREVTATHIRQAVSGYHVDGLPFRLEVRVPNQPAFVATLDEIVATIKANVNYYVYFETELTKATPGYAGYLGFKNRLKEVLNSPQMREIDLVFAAVVQHEDQLELASFIVNNAGYYAQRQQQVPMKGCSPFDSIDTSAGDVIFTFTTLPEHIKLLPNQNTDLSDLSFLGNHMTVPNPAIQKAKQKEIYDVLVNTLHQHPLTKEAREVVDNIVQLTDKLDVVEGIDYLKVVNNAITDPTKNTKDLVNLAYQLDEFPSRLHNAISVCLITLAALAAIASLALAITGVGAVLAIALFPIMLGSLLGGMTHHFKASNFYTENFGRMFGLPKQLDKLASELNKPVTPTLV